MHHDIQSIWTYYSIEQRYAPKIRDGKIYMESSLVLSQAMRETFGEKEGLDVELPYVHDMEDVTLFTDAINPSIWYIGDRLIDPILIAVEKIDKGKGNYIQIFQYANFEFFKMNIYTD